MMEKTQKLNKAKLPILGISNVISRFSDEELQEVLFVAKILNSNNRSYGWNRGKYGTITDGTTNKTYRISQEAFERLNAILNGL